LLRRRRRNAAPPAASRLAKARSSPPGDRVGACAASAAQVPARPGTAQDCPGGQEASAQQVSSTQLPETQSVGFSQLSPFGA